VIRPKVLLAADTVIRDAATNSVSAIHVFEQFAPPGYPLLVPRLTVFAMLEREHGDAAAVVARLQIRLDGTNIFERDTDVNFGESLINRIVLQFQGFVLPAAGTVRMVLAVGDQQVESYGIQAIAPPAPPPPEPEVLG